MNTEHDLSSHLSREAERFERLGGTALALGQVLDRAGEIRRGRRMRATIVMAAVVLAVAVPTAVVATKGHHDKPVTPAQHAKVDTSPLSLTGLGQGDEPGSGFVEGDVFHRGATNVSFDALGGHVNEVAPLATGYLVSVATGGDVIAHYVDAAGRPGAEEWLISGRLAVSDDQHVGAFVEPDGTVTTVRDDGTARTFMRVPRGTGFDTVAVSGDCGPTPKDRDPCAVWVQSGGRKPASWFVTSNAASTGRTEYRTLADVRDHGTLAAGTTQVRDDLSTCSAVETSDSDAAGWTTCGHQMVAFSPDGKYVLAMPDGDGLGPTGLAVYDADDGTALLDVTVADHGYVRQMVWEDSSHVLATVYQAGQWAVVRVGLDGSREYALPPVAGQDDVQPPFVLPVT